MLRERTATSHRRVEQQLDLISAVIPARMLAVLQLLGGFWASQEPQLDDWFAAHPDVADSLHWPRRAKLPRLRDDAQALAAACAAPAVDFVAGAPVFADVDMAAVLGWLYVAEGSTLGGAVIDSSLRRAGFPCRLTNFAPYPEGPQPMWRAYLAHLERWTAGDTTRVELVVDAGVATFTALERWIARAAQVAA